MKLPESYTQKPNAIPAYFTAIQDAKPPDRFSVKFLEQLEFNDVNDRLFVGILKELGFIDQDGKPKQRYFEYLDKERSAFVLADGIKEMFSGLFSVKSNAQDLKKPEVIGKLKTLYAGKKSDNSINRIAGTFLALCPLANFTNSTAKKADNSEANKIEAESSNKADVSVDQNVGANHLAEKKIAIKSLQYTINIILPDTRDQAVYDSIFKSLTQHLGS